MRDDLVAQYERGVTRSISGPRIVRSSIRATEVTRCRDGSAALFGDRPVPWPCLGRLRENHQGFRHDLREAQGAPICACRQTTAPCLDVCSGKAALGADRRDHRAGAPAGWSVNQWSNNVTNNSSSALHASQHRLNDLVGQPTHRRNRRDGCQDDVGHACVDQLHEVIAHRCRTKDLRQVRRPLLLVSG